MTQSGQGYYSIVQYSEFPERGEFVNIGVLLFAGMHPHVSAQFSKSPRRIEKAFGINIGVHYQRLVEAFYDRLRMEFAGEWSKEKIERFISMRSGKIRLSPLRSNLVKDASSELLELFETFVSEPSQKKRTDSALVRFKHKISLYGLENFLDRPEPIELPQGTTIKAPYGYQNGRYNLIAPLSLREDPDSALKKASAQAIQGQWLYDQPAFSGGRKLIVVADMEGQDSAFVQALSQVMEDHHVGFYGMNDIEPLANDIRKNASLRSRS